jgi:hypothetical protein
MPDTLRLPEILLDVFDQLCELEFEDYQDALLSKVEPRVQVSDPRLLKRSLHSVNRVCKSWRMLIMDTPTFWITIISVCRSIPGPGLQYLDVRFEVPYDKQGFDVLMEWLDSKILPLSHRVQICKAVNLTDYESQQPQLLLDHFQQRHWPKLPVFGLEFIRRCTFEASHSQIPCLRCAKFKSLL